MTRIKRLTAALLTLALSGTAWAASDNAAFVGSEQRLCYDGESVVTTVPVQITLADESQMFTLVYKSNTDQRTTQAISYNDTNNGIYTLTVTLALSDGETHRDTQLDLVSIYTQTSGTTSLSSTYMIRLYAQPYPTITNDDRYCGLEVELTADNAWNDISTYDWVVDNGELSQASGDSVTLTVSEPMTVGITMTHTTGETCVASTSKSIELTGNPTGTLAYDDQNPEGKAIEICSSLDDEKEMPFGATVTLTGFELFTLTLSNGQTFDELTTGATDIEVIASSEGQITISDIEDTNGCHVLDGDATGTLTVVDRKPEISMPTDTSTFSSGKEVVLSVQLTDEGNDYEWTMADEQSDYPSTFSNQGDGTTLMTSTMTGLHKLVYTETNYGESGTEQGCPAQAERTIYIENEPLVPNGFSPNGDGVNDALVIVGLVEQNELAVYDSTGKIVYSKTNYRNDWTADNLPDGYYIYTVKGDGMKTVKETLVIKRSHK